MKKTVEVYECTSVVEHFLCMLKALGSTSSTAKTNREIDTYYFSPNPQQALLLYSHFTVRQLWASYSRESVLRKWVGWWVVSFYPWASVDSAWTERNDCQAGCSGVGNGLLGSVLKIKLLVSLKPQVTPIFPPNIEGRDCRLGKNRSASTSWVLSHSLLTCAL